MTADPLLLTVSDLCLLLNISRSTFFSQRACGRIPLQPVRIGKKLLFRADEVKDWVNQGCQAKNWKWTPQKRGTKAIVAGMLISLCIVCPFLLLVHVVPITWVTDHPNSYGLQGSIIGLIVCLILGYCKPKWRKWCWGTAGIAFLVLMLSLLGGNCRQ
jgi:predicted DNA-binding transcriptional regulator AlpA